MIMHRFLTRKAFECQVLERRRQRPDTVDDVGITARYTYT